MVTVRCTRKLLQRVPIAERPAAPSTVLGDWYANVLFSRPQQLVLCVSERSLLPVVLLAKELHTLAPRLAVTVGQVLQKLGVAPPLIDQELGEMRDFTYGPTQNRRVLGSLNDFMFQLSWHLHDAPDKNLVEHSLHLAETPCGPLGHGFPDRMTVELFQSARASTEALH